LAERVEMPFYLETNSTLPGAAVDVAGVIDVAACDIKLEESGVEDGRGVLFKRSLETIEIFNDSDCLVFAKIMILPKTTVATIMPAVTSIAEINPEIPLVLQPVTPHRSNPERLIEMMDTAGRYLRDVRVIPQTQRVLGVL
ncbi:hypothetical protein DRJ16_07340, partial [Candidatus Woesearchaeota archaeon]